MATSSLLHSDCQEAQHICTHLKMEKLLSEIKSIVGFILL